MGPCTFSASMAYAEQVGVKRQLLGNNGEMTSWYRRTGAISNMVKKRRIIIRFVSGVKITQTENTNT